MNGGKNIPTVYIPHGGHSEREIFLSRGWAITNSLDHADLLCLTGGADISNELYGQHKHTTTRPAYARDEYELAIAKDAIAKKIGAVGICRGGQLLNVLSGGSMFQHVDKHMENHLILDLITGEKVKVTSCHHQMMIPDGNYVGIARAYNPDLPNRKGISTLTEKMSDSCDETIYTISEYFATDWEAIFYPDTKSFCFQGHPEWCKLTANYFFSCIDRYLNM